jgi:type IV pilus assembly protein PilA
MKTMQKGFTLIELMIVVAIIAILAAIAIPAYQNYLIRTQVSEASVLTDGAKTAVAEYYSNTGKFPGSNSSAGLALAASISGKYVLSVDVAAGSNPGVIFATFNATQANAAIQGLHFALSPITTSGSISWSCNDTAKDTTVDPKYLPQSCRNAG